MKRSVTEPATAARLLLAAGALDMLVVLLLTKMALPTAADHLHLDPPQLLPVLTGIACLIAYWLVTETVGGGWSIGRACLMIEPRRPNGARPGLLRRLMRLALKLPTFGLAGLRLDRLSGYDRAAGYVWISTFGTGTVLRSTDGRITVVSGQSTGRSVRFQDFSEEQGVRVLRIGRDPGRQGLVLKDSGISARHATLVLRGGTLMIHDGQPNERPSTNGVFIAGQRIPQSGWHAVSHSDEIRLGPVALRVDG